MEDNMHDIINNFKSVLNNSYSKDNSSDAVNSSSSDFNITPDMLSNLIGNLNNSEGKNSSSNSSSNNYNTSESNNSKDSSSNFSGNIDFETILKIKSIMETLNKKDDPRSNLLYSLKPYLRETRQKKLDQYVNLFKITEVTNLFKNEKGDGK